jgi:tRNA pseudouridine38-40 synthase
MRYFLVISYKGTNYSGWQIQENASTIQGEINRALSVLLKTPTECMGSGRTDAGVHALQQIAHFDGDDIGDKADFRYKLNAILPTDIVIRDILHVRTDAHARFDATSRSYKYFIHQQKDPFVDHTSYFFSATIDLKLIQDALELIKVSTDFEAFSKVHTDVNHFNCRIFDVSWEPTSTGFVFYIRADRFLRGMVRALVGTLLDVGTGKTSVLSLERILKGKNRSEAGRSVSPDGLYLHSIEYPADIYL